MWRVLNEQSGTRGQRQAAGRDPTGATAERGKQLFKRSVATLSEAMEEVKTFDFGR